MSSAPELPSSESAKAIVHAKAKRKKVLAWIGGAVVTPVIVGLGVAYMADVFGPSSVPASTEGPGTGVGTGPPLTAVVGYGNEASPSPCGYWGLDWVLPGGPSQLPSPSNMKTRDSLVAFAAAHHAVPTYGSSITLTIQAHAAHSVVLTGMQVIVVQRRPAVEGAYMVPGGCGGITPRWLSINSLDSDQPQVTAQEGQNQGQMIPAISFPFTVSEGVQMTLSEFVGSAVRETAANRAIAGPNDAHRCCDRQRGGASSQVEDVRDGWVARSLNIICTPSLRNTAQSLLRASPRLGVREPLSHNAAGCRMHFGDHSGDVSGERFRGGGSKNDVKRYEPGLEKHSDAAHFGAAEQVDRSQAHERPAASSRLRSMVRTCRAASSRAAMPCRDKIRSLMSSAW